MDPSRVVWIAGDSLVFWVRRRALVRSSGVQMGQQHGILLLALATALVAAMVTSQEEPVTQFDQTPTVDSSIAENEESTEPPAETESVTDPTTSPSEDPVSFHVGQRSQTEGMAGSASSNSESSNSENNDSLNVETMQAGPGMDLPAGSVESKENVDAESEESFTLPAGK